MECPSLMGMDLGNHNSSDGIHAGAHNKIFWPDVLEAIGSRQVIGGD
jgi:hypothetical protein